MAVRHQLKKLVSQSGLIMMSRLVGAGVGFLTQFLLVKLMGAHHLGLFYAGSSLAAILGVIAAQGYPQIAGRFVGRYRHKNDAFLCGTFTGHATREGLLAATVLALLVVIWAQSWPGLDGDARLTYLIAAWMILAVSSLNILTNVAGGMRNFALCYVPEGLFRPIVFFVILGLLGFAGFALTAELAMTVFALITAGIAVAVALILSHSLAHVQWRDQTRPALSWRWRREAWQLILMAMFTNFFADFGILVVVPFLSSSEVAIFGLCLKLALLVGYFVQIGQQMAVPDMADARHSQDHNRLRRAAWRSIVLPSAITMTSIVAIYVAGDQLLSFFGPEFAAGRRALLILLAAQLLRSLAGPSAHLLTLSGIQSINMSLSASALLLLLASSAVLSPNFGVEGAAYAVLITYCYWIAASAVALRWLREPSVDIVWLTWHSWRTPNTAT